MEQNIRIAIFKRNLKKWFNYCIIFVICFYVVKTAFSFALMTQLVSFLPYNHQVGKNILVVGIDEVDGTKRSDAIVVLHLNPNESKIRALSIPRDTRVNIDKVGISKINHAYAHGKVKLLKKTVSEFLSIPIDNYVVINAKGIKALIDEIGGVTIHIEEDMVYSDHAANLHINFSKGDTYMGGEDLIKFLRYRNNSKGDIGRIARQQEVVELLFEQIFKLRTLVLSPKIIATFVQSVKTDMGIIDINYYLKLFLDKRDFKTIQFYTVPGSIRLIDGVSYWRPDIVYLDNLISKTFVDYKEVLNEVDDKVYLSNKQISRVSEQLEIDKKQAGIQLSGLTVEVLNGNGYKGVAKSAADFLTVNGLIVKNIGNSQSFNYANTLIVDWKGNVENSIKLAQTLKIQPENIIIYNRQDKPLDITLVLGKDWNETYIEGLVVNEGTN